MNSITFFGGAGSVTGSKYVVQIGGKRLLLDCGMFQGLSNAPQLNQGFPFDPREIDAVVITHAHLDHSGMLPLLVRAGYGGNIYSTYATKDITSLLLQDAAAIALADQQYKEKHGIPIENAQPIFTSQDIQAVVDRFIPLPYMRDKNAAKEILPGIWLSMYDSGHILGSAICVLEYQQGGEKKRLAFTGDMGRTGMPLLRNPEVPPEEIATLVMESTYGYKEHLDLDVARDRLAKAVLEVCKRKGVMVVPSFALGRTQMLVYIIHKLVDQGIIPRFPIFVDSPLASEITEVYNKYAYLYDSETNEDFSRKDDIPLAFRNLEYITSSEQSKALNTKQGPFMVISASGMMSAGRVVHHLRHRISDKRNAIFVTGYQAEGTTGRKVLEGASHVDLLGDSFPVRAQVFKFNEFSAHADQDQLISFARSIQGLTTIALVHGEGEGRQALANALQRQNSNWNIVAPNEGQIISI